MKKVLNLIWIVSLLIQPSAFAQVTPTQEQLLFQKEYALNGGFELGTSKWSRYLDAAGAAPVDCVGGSPTVGLASSTTNPIQGKASGVITKPASNVQGQGYATTVTLDKAARTKMITVSGSYEIVSGTYVGGTSSTDSDITVYLYDVTGAAVIQPAGYKLDGAVTGNTYNFNAVFQSPQYTTDTRDIRVCLHHATTSASAFSLKLDQVKVGVQNKSQGPPTTDSVSFVPALSASWGTPTNVSASYLRDGKYLVVNFGFQSGTASAAAASITIPAGLAIDTSVISGIQRVGDFSANGAPFLGNMITNTSASSSIVYFSAGTGAFNTTANANAWANATLFSGSFRIPIAGWGSTVTMSDQSSGRSVVFTGSVSPSQALTAAVTNLPLNAIKDNTGSWTGSTFRVPEPGDYLITYNMIADSGASTMRIYKNAILLRNLPTINTSAWVGGALTLENLVAGDILSFRSDSAVTVTASTLFGISKIQGSQQIAASESVTVRVRNSTSSFTSGAGAATVVFTTKTYDSHNAYNTTTGVFTAPVSGKYSVKASILTQALVASTNDRVLNLYSAKNVSATGAPYSTTSPTSGTSKSAFAYLNDTVDLLAGETWALQLTHNYGATMTMIGTDAALYLAIERVGN